MSKKPTIASLQARIAELEAKLAAATGTTEAKITEQGQTSYTFHGVKQDGLHYTPSAVDAIRVYTWPLFLAGVPKKEIIANLISQGFVKATVRARVGRIFDGTEESCYSEAIRARLGLDQLEEMDEEDGEE